jgi:NAD(P)-dependent dehydrogenase (short-subunit alcohol dehydrogenase family)
MRRFDGCVAAFIGGGCGMGRAVCQRLAEKGAQLHVCNVSPDSAKAVADEVEAVGGRAVAHQLDATAVPALKELSGRIEAYDGVLHVMHNQVGVTGAAGLDVSSRRRSYGLAANVWCGYPGQGAPGSRPVPSRHRLGSRREYAPGRTVQRVRTFRSGIGARRVGNARVPQGQARPVGGVT